MNTKSYLKRYLNDVIYSQAFSEGIAATFPETERILEGKKVDGISSSDYEVIISLKRAWQYIYDNLGKDFYYEDIALLNAIVSDATNDRPGQLRQEDVFVRDKDNNRWYPELPKEYDVRDTIFKLNQINDPLEKGFAFFAYFTRSQVFNNCNKRTSFLLANKVFLENELGILYPTPNAAKDQEYKIELVEYYKSQNTDKLFKLLLENNFHNYKLDSIRKESKSETVPCHIVLEVIKSSTESIKSDVYDFCGVTKEEVHGLTKDHQER